MSGPYLAVRDLTISMHCRSGGHRVIVNGVNIEAERGRVTGLIGESGSGKSLSCQAMLGLLPRNLQARGAVSLGGVDMPLAPKRMAAARKARGARAAMILQNPMSCFDPLFTIAAHFRETLAAHATSGEGGPGISRQENAPPRWRATLADVGFDAPDAILPLYPFQMSGGMLQRVMIALALALESPFLIADEATTDLDAVAQARVLDLMESLVRTRDMGILLVTHDLSVIARLADSVYVMRHGEMVERGDVQAIFDAPRHTYTQALLAAHFALYDHAPLSLPVATHRGTHQCHRPFSKLAP